MPASLPAPRKWFGYSAIAATLLVTYGLWIGCLAAHDDWYENPWKYPAKVGSHGTLLLMCWAFILATRFRPVERLFGGLDHVYKAHRVVGESAFFLIFLHPIFLAVAHADSSGAFFRYLWFSDDLVRNTGIVALAAFILLVALSIYVKIAYHRWKRTHDFFGLLLVLVVFHGAISGGEIMRYPLLLAWHGAWVAVGLAAYVYIRVLYRFVGPQYDYVTRFVRDAGDSITEVELSPVGRKLRSRPGQFVYISFDSDAVTEEPHPFSISNAPEAPHLRLSIKRLGDWTSDISKIRAGEPARIWGPYGHFSRTLLEHPELPVVMLGGGIGITPFLSIVGSEDFARRRGSATLVYSVPDEPSFVYRAELEARAAQLGNFTFVAHDSGREGFINRAYLERLTGNALAKHLFLVCGPPAMMKAMRKLLTEAGVAEKQIVMEEFDIR